MRGRERQEERRPGNGRMGEGRDRAWDDPTEFRAMGPSRDRGPGAFPPHHPDERGWHGEQPEWSGEYQASYEERRPQPRAETGYGAQRPPEDGWGWSPGRGADRAERYERVPELVGKGPKGYQRSDERVREHVCERLSDGYLDASDIEVTVDKGAVALIGTVSDKRAKRIAEDLAEACPGVVEVDNRLRVRAARRH